MPEVNIRTVRVYLEKSQLPLSLSHPLRKWGFLAKNKKGGRTTWKWTPPAVKKGKEEEEEKTCQLDRKS
jgi:hypothetical protein